jgi:copper homeostasis protein
MGQQFRQDSGILTAFDDAVIAVLFQTVVPYSQKGMKNELLLEISVQSVEAALAAERIGASRIELCEKLEVGGITPGVDLMRAVRRQIRLPIFSMIRPRGGDFVYTDGEFAEMKSAIGIAKESGMDGVVLGALRKDRCVDVERTRELVEIARPLPVTYHRAFDECADLQRGLEDVIQTGAARILTSGGAARAAEGAATLAELVLLARDRIIIVPGAGINASNVQTVARVTRATEIHSGLSSVLGRKASLKKFEAGVRELVQRLREYQTVSNSEMD